MAQQDEKKETLLESKDDYVTIGVGMLGNSDAGKSSTIGALITKEKDNGRGYLRSMVSRHPHEIKSGNTSDVAYRSAVFGKNRITFCDLAGHEKYLKVTIHGLGTFIPDLICLCADKYVPTYRMTNEHIGLSLRMKIPFIILMTKIDMHDKEVTSTSLDQLRFLIRKASSRKLYVIKSQKDIDVAIQTYLQMSTVPVFHISNVTGQGHDLLQEFLSRIKKPSVSRFTHPKKFMVDRDYRIKGVGLVVSGYNGGEPLQTGSKVLINNLHEGVIRSIHNDFRETIQTLPSGVRGCLALRTVLERVQTGSVISCTPLRMVQEFTANVEILSSHAITIQRGYQTVIHCGAVRRTAEVMNEEEMLFRGGMKGTIHFRIPKPAYLEVGQALFFREGRVVGDGVITKLL